MAKDILVIEDSPEIRILLESSLEEYHTIFCSTLRDAALALNKQPFQMIILDIGLPDGDGLRFLAELAGKPETRSTPVMILSARADTANKVMAFSVGAEDFVTKPFDPIELKARVAARLRKFEKDASRSETIKVGDLELDLLKQKVRLVGSKSAEPLDLTTLEFRLLTYFAKAPEHVLMRETLLNDVWGYDVSVTDRTVDTHVAHLRKKISNSKCKIETVVGAGYRFIVG